MKGFQETGDCFAVKELEEGVFEVRHYPDRETRRPCCKVKVHLTDADRARAIPDADPHGKAACLARADAMVEARHAKRIVDNNVKRP